MKKVLLVVATFLWGIIPVFSQEHATCNDAISVTTSSYGPVAAKSWADPSLCVPNDQNMYFGKKHKVVWFSFVAPYDTILTFQIVPENPTDDFDFMLFEASLDNFCEKEKLRKVQPIRTNFAKPTPYSKGVTGLSAKATDTLISPGYNSPYSSAVQVKKGERFYLVVDNYISDKGGFTLKIPFLANSTNTANHKPPVKNTPAPTPVKPIAAPVAVKVNPVPVKSVPLPIPVAVKVNPAPIKVHSTPNFFIHVLDSLNHPIKANLCFDSTQQQGNPIIIDTTDYALQLKKNQTINILVSATGHIPYQASYSGTNDNSIQTLWVRLKPGKAIKNINLENVLFERDSPLILPSSMPTLNYLVQLLTANKNLRLLIKGYANDPNGEQLEIYDQELSEKRADAVKDYLSSHGIDEKRMESIGYGSSKLLYSKPTNEEQKLANRRVEFEIK